MKKLLAMLLTVLSIFSLVSCSLFTGKVSKPKKVALENVYSATKVKMPEDMNYLNVISSNGEIYGWGNKSKSLGKKTNEYGDEYEDFENITVVYKISPDFSSFEKIFSQKDDYVENGTTSTNTYLSGLYPANGGGVWILMSNYFSDWTDPDNYVWENSSSLIKYADGKLSENEIKIDIDDDSFYASSITELQDGSFVVAGGQSIFVLNSDGTFKKKADSTAFSVYNCVVTKGGKYLGSGYDNESYCSVVCEIDPANFSIKKLCDIKEAYNTPMITSDGKVFVQVSSGISEVDLKSGALTKVCDFINSDINPSNLGNLSWVKDDDFIATEYNYNQKADENGQYSEPETKVMYLSPVGEKVEKYVLTCASLYMDYNVTNAVVDFNRANKDYRITIKTYDNVEDGENALDLDILAGNVPDIIVLGNLDVEKYVAKGFVEPLDNYFDDEIKKEDILDNIIEATSVDGKIYQLIPSFSIQTVVGKKSIFGDRKAVTFEDLNNALAEYPGAKAFNEMERGQLIRSILAATMTDYVDYANGTCKFDDGSFAKLLEFVKDYPETIDWDTYYQDYDYEESEMQYKNNKTLCQELYISSFENVGRWGSKKTFGEDVSYIGYPTTSDNGSVIQPSFKIAMSSKSAYKEQVWSFFKTLMSDEFYEDLWEFPTKKAAFDKVCKDALELKEEEDYYYDRAISSTFVDDLDVPDNENEESKPLFTKEEVDAIADYIKSVNKLAGNGNDPVVDIVIEEAEAFFKGKKSADEVCKLIQNRASLYISENA